MFVFKSATFGFFLLPKSENSLYILKMLILVYLAGIIKTSNSMVRQAHHPEHLSKEGVINYGR
jgi:hypothetical protein